MVIMFGLPACFPFHLHYTCYNDYCQEERFVSLNPFPSCSYILPLFLTPSTRHPSLSPLLWCKVKDGLRLTKWIPSLPLPNRRRPRTPPPPAKPSALPTIAPASPTKSPLPTAPSAPWTSAKSRLTRPISA